MILCGLCETVDFRFTIIRWEVRLEINARFDPRTITCTVTLNKDARGKGSMRPSAFFSSLYLVSMKRSEWNLKKGILEKDKKARKQASYRFGENFYRRQFLSIGT